MTIHERFEAVNDEFLEFDRIENKRSQRPDIHAFLLLDDIFPNAGHDMVTSAEHDEIWLDPMDDQLKLLTDEQIVELVRCGARHDRHNGCLAMFV